MNRIWIESQDIWEAKIRQYLSLENLIKLLSTKKYFMRKKSDFKDVNEGRFPINMLFRPQPVGISPELLKKQPENNQFEKAQQYKEISENCYISCWTLQDKENMLMWQSYASDYGACIVSSVQHFVRAFDYEEFRRYDVFCAKISYRDMSYIDSSDIYHIIKNLAYADEREVRFLFLPNQPSKQNKRSEQINNLSLKVDPTCMIDKIILSPFIHPIIARHTAKCIKSEYKIQDVSMSTINLKH